MRLIYGASLLTYVSVAFAVLRDTARRCRNRWPELPVEGGDLFTWYFIAAFWPVCWPTMFLWFRNAEHEDRDEAGVIVRSLRRVAGIKG